MCQFLTAARYGGVDDARERGEITHADPHDVQRG